MEFAQHGTTVEFLDEETMKKRLAAHALKLLRFQAYGYDPHYGQLLFHTSLTRYRCLAAGRQGGKTHSAAWEMADLCNPENRDDLLAFGVDLKENEVCIGYIVTPDRSNFETTPVTFTEALDAMEIPYEFSEAKQTWYLPSKAQCRTKVVYKSAKDPSKLRGGHPHIIWFDEPAFCPHAKSWTNLRNSTVKSRGIAIFSTTPADNENYYWLYDMVILRAKGGRDGLNKPVKTKPEYAYIAWATAENPHVSIEEMELQFDELHPLDFQREYLAKWDRGAGKYLKIDWLHRFTVEKSLHLYEGGETVYDIDRDKYQIVMGADLASREKERSDYFCAWVLAVDKVTRVGYFIDKIHDKIPFPQQVDRMQELIDLWNPIGVGIEATGYQISLQQTLLINNAGLQVFPIEAHGKKEDRIIAMSPTFRTGAVRIMHNKENDFIQEWISFPGGAHDDMLDAAQITLLTATFAMVPLRTKMRKVAPADIDPCSIKALDKDFDEEMKRVTRKGYQDEHLGLHF